MSEANRYPRDPVLIIDDEPQFLQSASFSLRTAGITNIAVINDSREVPAFLEATPVSAVLLDLMMPHVTGRDLLPAIAQKHPGVPVVVITAVNEVESAVECMRAGAFDYLVKPVDKTRLVTCAQKALEHREVRAENARLKESLLSQRLFRPEAFEGIITRNAAMLSLFRYIEAVAPSGQPVLVTGETGAGKEVIARAVHRASGRTGQFVAVNVAGLDDNLFSDTLFGHVRGAFTGAAAARDGLVSKAGNGTIFLDEIGDLAMESQVKLLRLLEDRTYYPIGGDAALTSTARAVVATNRGLDALRREGKFRPDLYYRLSTHMVRIPALRERAEDIPFLVEHFLAQAAEETDKKKPTVPRELATLLSTFAFPGNVRELRAMVWDAMSVHQGGILSMEPFRSRIGQSREGAAARPGEPGGANKRLQFLDELPTLDEAGDLLVAEALKRARNNQSIAAQMLGITRSALNKRINHPNGRP